QKGEKEEERQLLLMFFCSAHLLCNTGYFLIHFIFIIISLKKITKILIVLGLLFACLLFEIKKTTTGVNIRFLANVIKNLLNTKRETERQRLAQCLVVVVVVVVVAALTQFCKKKDFL